MRRLIPAHFLLAASLWLCAGIAHAASSAHPPQPGSNDKISDLNYELVWIEPGDFVMGSPASEPARDKAEGPQTLVSLTKGFWLGRTELTQAAYEAVAGENPSRFKEVGPHAPVERVSWLDAMEFCGALTLRERQAGRLPDGYAYTLPTEAQWEYAYRAGSSEAYPEQEPREIGWFDENSGETTHPVAQLKPNPWGLYDMSGNVLEWCFDWYGDYPGGEVSDPTGPMRGYYRMARGGSWKMGAGLFRHAARAGGSAARQDSTLGFRIALSVASEK